MWMLCDKKYYHENLTIMIDFDIEWRELKLFNRCYYKKLIFYSNYYFYSDYVDKKNYSDIR